MPQISLQHDGFDVQIEMANEASTNVYDLAGRLVDLARQLIGPVVYAQLAARLQHELGPRGASGNRFTPPDAPQPDAPQTDAPQTDAPQTGCPLCGSPEAARKGTRSRTVEVARLGAVEIERPYLECRSCGRSYTPYAAGLPERKRYAQPAMRRPIEATLETSYRRGAEAYPESPSARTLWRLLQEGPVAEPIDPSDDPSGDSSGDSSASRKEIAFPLAADAEAAQQGTCVADATRIPAREAGAQHSLSIAHAVQPDPTGSRPTLDRWPVSARVGSETRLRDALRTVPLATLVIDGKMDMVGVADQTGRCRWHLPRSVRYLLYNDGVKGEHNEALTREVGQLAHAAYPNAVAAQVVLTRWAAVRRWEAPQAATHVERAAPQIAIYAQEPTDASSGFTVETTSPAEREMREINRRFENGGQWTRAGAEHVLQWHQIYRHHPERWATWFPDSDAG